MPAAGEADNGHCSGWMLEAPQLWRKLDEGLMMQPMRVNDDITVCGAINVYDVAAIKAAGFRSIVCNRFDGEDPGQTAFSEIEAAAISHGLTVAWQAVGGMVADDDGVEFGQVVDGLPKPVFAYCRAGTRCIVLWSLSQAGRLPTDEIISQAANAGYDLRGLVPRIEALAAQRGK